MDLPSMLINTYHKIMGRVAKPFLACHPRVKHLYTVGIDQQQDDTRFYPDLDLGCVKSGGHFDRFMFGCNPPQQISLEMGRKAKEAPCSQDELGSYGRNDPSFYRGASHLFCRTVPEHYRAAAVFGSEYEWQASCFPFHMMKRTNLLSLFHLRYDLSILGR